MNAMNRAMNGGVMNGDREYTTWKVMNSRPFKHWVNLENGQEFDRSRAGGRPWRS